MAKEINHWCVVCGKGYHACDTCREIKSFAPWRTLTDTSEHYRVFLILKQFNNKLISKNEAREMLSNVDLTGREDFKESAKNVLDEIFKEEPVVHKSSKNNPTKPKDVEVDVVPVKHKEDDTEEQNYE